MTKKIVRTALLTALSVVMTRLLPASAVVVLFGLSPLTVRFSFGLIPIYLCALEFGAPYGGVCAGMADLIGYFINPLGGAYMPLMTLTAALGGALCGLITKRGKNPWWRVCLGIAGATLITAFLNTFLLEWMYGTPFAVLIWPRLISSALMCLIYCPVVILLDGVIRKIDKNAPV